MGPSHRPQFFQNSSSTGPFYGVQSFRRTLLQHRSLTGPSSCQTSCSCVGSPQAAASFRAYPPAAPVQPSVGCRGTGCFTRVLSMGCREILALAPWEHPHPPPPLALVSAELFLFYFLTSLSHSCCTAISSFLKY